MQNSSPVDSAVATPLLPPKSLQPGRLSRNVSAYTNQTHVFNPLPEIANFDGFSDLSKPDEIHPTSITKLGSMSKARPSGMSAWSSEAELSRSQRYPSNHHRQGSPPLDLNSSQTATWQPMPLHTHELSSHKTLDSLSSRGSLNIPTVEQLHPLRSNKSRNKPGRTYV
jgi:hypothetical protein